MPWLIGHIEESKFGQYSTPLNALMDVSQRNPYVSKLRSGPNKEGGNFPNNLISIIKPTITNADSPA